MGGGEGDFLRHVMVQGECYVYNITVGDIQGLTYTYMCMYLHLPMCCNLLCNTLFSTRYWLVHTPG